MPTPRWERARPWPLRVGEDPQRLHSMEREVRRNQQGVRPMRSRPLSLDGYSVSVAGTSEGDLGGPKASEPVEGSETQPH